MSLTFRGAPLASHLPEEVNFTIDAPAHRLFMHPFPRRVRASFGGEMVFDTDHGQLLHESNLLPQLYVPWEDVRRDLLTPTDHHTTCSFKGVASYWSVSAGGRTAENAAWSYPTPIPEVEWLAPYAAFYWDPLDAWYDEEEEVQGHLWDPYHRTDVRQSGRHVRVTAAGEVLGESRQARILSETGLTNRWYLPAGDCRLDLLTPTATSSHCPYKGWASYYALDAHPRGGDVAWVYPEPFNGVREIEGHLSFYGDQVEVEVDGKPVDTAWPPKNR